jgi:site-specific DNA-methyltransferase (adenine-specific)
LDLFWKQVNRVCKQEAVMAFTCSVKFGNTLINSNPKCFRYDLVWVKSAPCGFLNAKKMPMKKHEMVYIFYRKLPKVYTENIALHHKHKFLKEENDVVETKHKTAYGNNTHHHFTQQKNGESIYNPPLPNSVIKEENVVVKDTEYENREIKKRNTIKKEENYGKEYLKKKENFRSYNKKLGAKGEESHLYEPPLPNTIMEIKSEKGKHATQKPVALMEWLIKYYTREGDVVLDPTMGSGGTGIACKNLNREFIGIEKDEEIYKIALERNS